MRGATQPSRREPAPGAVRAGGAPLRRREDGGLLRIGHKGAAALAAENTLASLERAIELGVDLVEFDVLDVRGGTLVLAHSDDLHEVSHGGAHGSVRDRTLAELREVAPELPTLDEALAFLGERAPGVGVHVDVKWHGYEAAVVDSLRRHGAVDRALVSSFHASTVRAIARLEPRLARGLTYPFDRRGVSQRRALAPLVRGGLHALRRALPRRIETLLDRAGATVATLHYLVVSRATVERCHARGAPVVAWTVDEPDELRRLAALGVDGVVTNDPRIFAATLPS